MSRRLTLIRFQGERYTLAELSDLSGIAVMTIRGRLAAGWTIDQAITTPTPKQRRAGGIKQLLSIQ